MFRLSMFFYNLVLPLGFLIFLPGLIYKLIFRAGWKKTFLERFGIFGKERKERWKNESGGVWIHAVSVGESVIACSMIREILKKTPNCRIILSTTTTTGQELARSKVAAGVQVIFAPVDFCFTVSRFFNLLKVEKLVIFETEIWPNMLAIAHKRGVKTVLVNARMSDHSSKGYRRFKCFFGPLLMKFNVIAAQSQADAERFKTVSPEANVKVCGNLKFDQYIDPALPPIDFSKYFGKGNFTIIIAASTHPGEEALIINVFTELAKKFDMLRLVIAPRHAERGGEVAALLKSTGISFAQRSKEFEANAVKVVLADTTGELAGLMKGADIVIMGKSLAGQDEGHNLIEPALLSKPTVTGAILKNFRFILQILKEADAVKTVNSDADLPKILEDLLNNSTERIALGARANAAISLHCGATDKVISLL